MNPTRRVKVGDVELVEEALMLTQETLEPVADEAQRVLLAGGFSPTALNACGLLVLALSVLKIHCVEVDVVKMLVEELWPTLGMSPEDEARLEAARKVPKN